jgi:hypothetical protein
MTPYPFMFSHTGARGTFVFLEKAAFHTAHNESNNGEKQ